MLEILTTRSEWTCLTKMQENEVEAYRQEESITTT